MNCSAQWLWFIISFNVFTFFYLNDKLEKIYSYYIRVLYLQLNNVFFLTSIFNNNYHPRQLPTLPDEKSSTEHKTCNKCVTKNFNTKLNYT